MFRFSTSTLTIGLIYLVLVGLLVTTLAVARQRVLASPASEAEQEQWQAWRDEAARQERGDGPVSRRVPKATEPPTRVLLRDHFATSLLILIVLSTAVFFAMAAMIRGVVAGPKFKPDIAE